MNSEPYEYIEGETVLWNAQYFTLMRALSDEIALKDMDGDIYTIPRKVNPIPVRLLNGTIDFGLWQTVRKFPVFLVDDSSSWGVTDE